MAARNRIVNAGGGESNGTSQGANGQAVAVFQGLAQLVGPYIYISVESLPDINIPQAWTKLDYI